MGRGVACARALVAEWAIGAVLAYLAVDHGLPLWLRRAHDSLIYVLLIDTQLYLPLSWGLRAMGCVIAEVAWERDRDRHRRLGVRLDLEDLGSPDDGDLQYWVCEALEACGYRIEAAGLGERDGGADLILRRSDGLQMLLQHRQWTRERVGALAVRELYGLMFHHGAPAVRIVSLGGPDADAVWFTDGKSIELMSARELLRMVKQS